jgi:hypothetical protein
MLRRNRPLFSSRLEENTWPLWVFGTILPEGTTVQTGDGYPAKANGLKPLFTVGHSILEFQNFAALLKDHAVQLVVDVRSVPQSARLPHFSQPAFEKLLSAEQIAYLFLGGTGRPAG